MVIYFRNGGNFHRNTHYSAYTGLSGIELVEEMHPDVVLLDINLPDIDGLEVLERINNSSQAPPTIMLTASLIRYETSFPLLYTFDPVEIYC